MLKIILNDHEIFIPEHISLNEFLQMHVTHQTYAIAINRQFISRQNYAEITLKENDLIEIISPMQGG